MATRGQKTHSGNYSDTYIQPVRSILNSWRRVDSRVSSSDSLSAAVDAEHEVFKSSKSSNLYKAAVLKKVT